MSIATTPPPPYYVVVFVGVRAQENDGLVDNENYTTMAEEMMNLAKQQDGFLGVDTAKSPVNITVSYWRDLAAIRNWKQNMRHLQAQKMGREKWYNAYSVRICKVEREYGMAQA